MWDESWWEGREAGSDDQHHTLVSPPDAEGIFVFEIWLASSTQLKPDAQIGRASLAHGTADGGATPLSCDILLSLEEQPSVSSAAGQPVKEGLQASLEATGDASVQN
ncbi:G-protein alpha subunit [Moesziomyces antarcticus T-34]|uniref:G-protein alpha subunit n=1 Tax=Pseudozyma antarctica (strain T-34) TaxID=1151754 RepID=M9LTR0_PSEA3|nr:G-protein alpha subunit [Moesziomyces antarcticus T-34]